MSEIRFWGGEGMAPELSAQEREIRDRFVDQYLYDYHARSAALRIGYTESFADTWAAKFMDCPYVRQRIAVCEKATADDEKVEVSESTRRIRAMLMREANYRGPGSSHSARVGALTKLMSLYGMDSPIKTKSEITNRGGVMEVPSIAGTEDWQKAALESQGALQDVSKVE